MPNEGLGVVVSAYMGDQTRSTRGGCRENIRQLISLLEEMSAEQHVEEKCGEQRQRSHGSNKCIGPVG